MSLRTESLTQHFTRAEFACKGSGCCGGSAPVERYLVTNLERLRALVGKPLRINSGFRCLVHNRTIRSTDTSRHTIGQAADISCPPGMAPTELAEFAYRIPAFQQGGVGLYDWGIHVDVRPDGPARWDYRSKNP